MLAPGSVPGSWEFPHSWNPWVGRDPKAPLVPALLPWVQGHDLDSTLLLGPFQLRISVTVKSLSDLLLVTNCFHPEYFTSQTEHSTPRDVGINALSLSLW